MESIRWDAYPPIRSEIGRLIVKVGNQDRHGRGRGGTFAIKDQLKACGYQWEGTAWPGWTKTFLIDGFDVSSLQQEVWAAAASSVEVRIFDETERIFGIFEVEAGAWVATHDELDSLADLITDSGHASETAEDASVPST